MSLITPTFADKQELTPQGDSGQPPASAGTTEQLYNPWTGLDLPQPGPVPIVTYPAPAAEKKALKIACIGTAPSSRLLAPFDDPSWTIWACSPGNMNTLKRVDAWFEIHANLTWPQHKHYGEPYLAWLRGLKIPVYMQDKTHVSNALIFPKDELIKEFGPYFFTSSFAWMMGLAIMQGAKEIALYGIDMASHDEYIIQRPGAYYFFIEGAKRGIKIWAPYESDILQPPGLYGYDDVAPFGRKMLAREDELRARITSIDQQMPKMQYDGAYLRGALENQQYLREIWFGAGNSHSGERYLERLLENARNPDSKG